MAATTPARLRVGTYFQRAAHIGARLALLSTPLGIVAPGQPFASAAEAARPEFAKKQPGDFAETRSAGATSHRKPVCADTHARAVPSRIASQALCEQKLTLQVSGRT